MPNPDSPRSAGVDGRTTLADEAWKAYRAGYLAACEYDGLDIPSGAEAQYAAAESRASAYVDARARLRSSVSDDGGRGLTVEERVEEAYAEGWQDGYDLAWGRFDDPESKRSLEGNITDDWNASDAKRAASPSEQEGA